MQQIYENRYYALSISDDGLVYRAGCEDITLAWPQFEIESLPGGAPKGMTLTGVNPINDVTSLLTVKGALDCGAELTLEIRACSETPFLRFRYVLSAASPLHLTKSAGEALTYLSYASEGAPARTEVRFSNYDELIHAYTLKEVPAFRYEDELMGPMLTEQRGEICMLTAYEHGSMYPDKFIAFANENDRILLRALRGNYWHMQDISVRPYDTVWLQLGAVAGSADDLARAYRSFQLKYCSPNAESRRPYIFYNSWGYQERNLFYRNKPYLSTMNEAHMLEEVEIAHRLGIDIFVLDVGWFLKTGDWSPNPDFFPRGLEPIRKKLDEYGMKLGLWFNPTVAAASSRMLAKHREALASTDGVVRDPWPVWETEESYPMCLVSDYWEAFADRLIQLSDELGVRYFKWDGIGMYECNCGDHLHGSPDSPADERSDCYAFQLVKYMAKVIDKLCAAHPDALVDFDITEGGRAVGLAFLSSGKYFTINNGPYYQNYDIKLPKDAWSNIFVNPGPARTWVCRQNLTYDKWIPSVLMMAHYMPDDPADSQMVNLASLILGHNGIWGDLGAISDDGVALINSVLTVYKRVRDDITEAYPVTMGRPGELFEVREKLNAENGRGAVVVFANHPGKYRYRLQSKKRAGALTVFGNAKLTEKDGEVWLEAEFDTRTAAIVFFE